MFLHGDSITLRALEKKDMPLLLEMINDPEIEASVVGWSYPVSEEQQLMWLNNIQSDKCIRFAIDDGTGIVGVSIISSIDYKNGTANLNLKLPKNYRGKGYASQAVKLMINYCFFELNMNCLTANVIADNDASIRLWEKNGFKRDGLLRSRVYKNGVYKDLIAYSLLRNEYEK